MAFLFSSPNIPKLEKKKKVKLLLKALEYPCEETKTQAAGALGRISNPLTYDKLFALALNDSDSAFFTLNGIFRIDPKKAMQDINEVLVNVRPHIQKMQEDPLLRNIVHVLGEREQVGAVDSLLALLKLQEYNSFDGEIIEAIQKIRKVLGEGDEKTIEEIDKAVAKHKELVALFLSEGEKEAAEADKVAEEARRRAEDMDFEERLKFLIDLCIAYQSNNPTYRELEPLARAIGEQLNIEGGIDRMRQVFDALGGRPGSRTIEMLWGGIGAWMG